MDGDYNMKVMECGPKDVVWIGRAIRVFITSRLEDRTFFMVTAPHGTAPFGIDRVVMTSPAGGGRASHVFSLYPGEAFGIGVATVRLEDCEPRTDGVSLLRDRLLYIDVPDYVSVVRDASAHRGIAARRRRAQ